MFGNDVEYRYKQDGTFRRVVDMLRSFLSYYHITPGELREATMLAATMHEAENVRPLFIRPYGSLDNTPSLAHSVYLTPPAMFGGMKASNDPARTATGTTPDKPKYNCICAAKRSQYEITSVPHSQTCRDYNWSYYHPTPPFQQHVYGEWHDGLGDSKWRMCVRCQMSSTYIEHNKLTTCTGGHVSPKS